MGCSNSCKKSLHSLWWDLCWNCWHTSTLRLRVGFALVLVWFAVCNTCAGWEIGEGLQLSVWDGITWLTVNFLLSKTGFEYVSSWLPILKATTLTSPLLVGERHVKTPNLPFSQHLVHLRPIPKPLLPAHLSKTHHVCLLSSSLSSKKLLWTWLGPWGQDLPIARLAWDWDLVFARWKSGCSVIPLSWD